jgi:zinc protease
MRQAPPVGPLPALVAPTPTTFRLANGLEVVAVPRRAAPLVAFNLIIRGGGDLDPPERAGLASVTAEMLDEGAGQRGALEVAEALDRLGADLGLGAGRDASQLTLQVPAHALDQALAIAADMLVRPRFERADWDRVRHDRLTALAQRRDQPEAVADLVTSLVFFGRAHPYGHPVDGFEATAAGITLEESQLFFRQLWRPSHSVLAMAGEFDVDTLPAALERAFGAWEPGPAPESPPPPERPALPRLVIVDRPGAPQSVLRVVGAGSSRLDPDRPALSMLNVLLGGSFTSRLNFLLREKKGYTYGAGSSFGFYRRPSAFVARTSVFTQMTAPAVIDLLGEIARTRVDPISTAELIKAQASLLDRIAEALSTSAGTAATFAEIGLHGLPPDEPARFVRQVMEADEAKLQALAARYLDPDRMAVVIVGDRSAIEPDLRAAGLPEPVLLGPEGDPTAK